MSRRGNGKGTAGTTAKKDPMNNGGSGSTIPAPSAAGARARGPASDDPASMVDIDGLRSARNSAIMVTDRPPGALTRTIRVEVTSWIELPDNAALATHPCNPDGDFDCVRIGTDYFQPYIEWSRSDGGEDWCTDGEAFEASDATLLVQRVGLESVSGDEAKRLAKRVIKLLGTSLAKGMGWDSIARGKENQRALRRPR